MESHALRIPNLVDLVDIIQDISEPSYLFTRKHFHDRRHASLLVGFSPPGAEKSVDRQYLGKTTSDICVDPRPPSITGRNVWPQLSSLKLTLTSDEIPSDRVESTRWSTVCGGGPQ